MERIQTVNSGLSERASAASLAFPEKGGITRRSSLKLDLGLCAVYTVLIVAGMYVNIASVAAFVLAALAFFCLPLENTLCQMLYLMPFATVFKMSPSATSFMTMLEIYVVLMCLLRFPLSLQPNQLICIGGLFCSLLLATLYNHNYQWLLFIKLFVSLFLLRCFQKTDHKTELHNYTVMLVCGLIVSSAIAKGMWNTAALRQYIVVDRMFQMTSAGYTVMDTSRFSGFNSDSNYFAVNVCIALSALLVLAADNRLRKPWLSLASAGFLVVFGLMTISKSFVAMLVLLFAYACVLLAQRRRLKPLALLIGMTLLLVAVAIGGNSESIRLLLGRFRMSGTASDISSGRFAIWATHIAYWKDHPAQLLLGLGLNPSALPTPHNTYIEMLTDLGVVGTLLYGGVIVSFIRPKVTVRRGWGRYLILCVILVMYAFLGMLTWFDLPFHLYLGYCFMNDDMPSDSKIGGKSDG